MEFERKKIEAVRREYSGRILKFKFTDGSVMGYPDAIILCRNGGIEGCIVSENNGGAYIKTKNDGDDSNNLRDYPQF